MNKKVKNFSSSYGIRPIRDSVRKFENKNMKKLRHASPHSQIADESK